MKIKISATPVVISQDVNVCALINDYFSTVHFMVVRSNECKELF